MGKRSMANSTHIDQLLRRVTDAGDIPGLVAVAGTSREVIYQGAFGKRDMSTADPYRRFLLRRLQRRHW
jgi:hypothetical protein